MYKERHRCTNKKLAHLHSQNSRTSEKRMHAPKHVHSITNARQKDMCSPQWGGTILKPLRLECTTPFLNRCTVTHTFLHIHISQQQHTSTARSFSSRNLSSKKRFSVSFCRIRSWRVRSASNRAWLLLLPARALKLTRREAEDPGDPIPPVDPRRKLLPSPRNCTRM